MVLALSLLVTQRYEWGARAAAGAPGRTPVARTRAKQEGAGAWIADRRGARGLQGWAAALRSPAHMRATACHHLNGKRTAMARAGGRGNRAPFARATGRAAKRVAGSTAVTSTPSVRTTGLDVTDDLRRSIRSRMGAKLGKFAGRIERLSVRFEDANGPRGGVDTVCRVKVALSGLDSVVFESVGRDVADAASLAAAGVERAVRRALGRAGGGGRSSAARKKRVGAVKPAAATRPRRGGPAPEGGGLIGRRVGQGRVNLEAALDRPEKRRGDDPVDTSQPGVSASDRRAGGGSTARRNTKRNTAGATSALEDSARDRPTRKSTRKSENRAKAGSNLQRRQIRRVTSPQARAARSNARAR
ncbi:hypothetical protein BH11MYX4_BH11MYX4_06220 [soil metagenome]